MRLPMELEFMVDRSEPPHMIDYASLIRLGALATTPGSILIRSDELASLIAEVMHRRPTEDEIPALRWLRHGLREDASVYTSDPAWNALAGAALAALDRMIDDEPSDEAQWP